MLDFIFYLALAGILIASLQDLKRREVDNWLNLLLIFSSFAFFAISSVFNGKDVFFISIFSFAVMFFVSRAFYYGRVFAGGDAQLMLAIFGIFAFSNLLANIGAFILFMLLASSIWGIGYSSYLFFSNYKKCSLEFKRQFDNIYLKYFVLIGIVLFILSYFHIVFLFFALLFLFAPVLFAYARSVESVCLFRNINGKELVEGDWLAENVRYKGKTFKYNWEGLDKKEIEFLKNYKGKIKVKDGIPFVPSFLIAFFLYYFAKEWLLTILTSLF